MHNLRRTVRRTRRPLLALLILIAALLVGYGSRAFRSSDAPAGAQATGGSSMSATLAPSASTAPSGVPLSTLPPQVARTARLVEQGGPFPYPDNDGVVFHNDEHHLPLEPDGFYHEYTVPTPGSADRGARRLVVGADGRYWYTGDHYESFELVDLDR